MRISTSQFQNESVIRMLEQQSKLNEVQQQISTGKRLLSPSDDPAAAARILDLKEVISINEQYLRNTDLVQARLETEDDALTSIINVYQRIRELTVQSLNSPLQQVDRDAIAVELKQQLSELTGLASRKDVSGDYLFSGFKGNTNPITDNGSGTYTYAGDQGNRSIQIGPNRTIQDTDNGYDLFFNVPGTSENAFSVVYNLITNLGTNTQTGASLTDMDAVMDNVIQYRSGTGARLNALETQTGVNEGLVLQSKQLLSDLEDLDFAEAVTELNLRRTGLEAAQQAYIRIQGLSIFNFL